MTEEVDVSRSSFRVPGLLWAIVGNDDTSKQNMILPIIVTQKSIGSKVVKLNIFNIFKK